MTRGRDGDDFLLQHATPLINVTRALEIASEVFLGIFPIIKVEIRNGDLDKTPERFS